MTLNPGGDPLAGGSMTVDGIPMAIPKNTIVTMPATAVAYSELFNGGTSAIPNGYMAHVSVYNCC
jgi:hypothetical protein